MHRRLIPRLLLVVIILLGAGTTAASTPAACVGAHCVYLPLVSTPEDAFISNVDLYAVPSKYEDDINIYGDLFAPTTAVYSATLEVRSYDDNGNLLGVGTGTPAFAATLPGQPNPFYFWTWVTSVDNIARYDIRVTGYSLAHPRTFVPLIVNVTSYEYTGTQLNIAGTMTNEHNVAVEDVRRVAWTLSQDIHSLQTFASHLEPFETVPFSVSLANNCCSSGSNIPYKIVAQGVVP